MKKHTFLILVFLQIIVMGLGIRGRNVDHDEGFYLSASYQVSQGKWLYKDFFYPQMPLFPYLMAGVGKLIGFSLLANRIISLLCSLVIFVVIVSYLRYRFRNEAAANTAALAAGYLYAMHTLTIKWHTVSKPYSHTELLLLIAAICLLLAYDKDVQFKRGALYSGFLFGTACGIKLFYFPLVIAFFLIIFIQNRKGWLQAVKPFIAGGLVPGIFAVYFLFHDRENFMFGNIYYHLLNAKWRKTIGYFGTIWIEKWEILYQGLLGRDITRVVLTAAAVCVILSLFIKGYRRVAGNYIPELFCGLIVMIQGVTFLFLTPFQEQYMVTLVPFMAVISGMLWIRFINNFRCASLLIPVLLLLYSYPAYQRVTKWSGKWDYSDVMRVGRLSGELSRIARPGDDVFSFWPGYAVMAGRKTTPGMESGAFGYRITYQLTERQARRYHLLKRHSILKKIAGGEYPILVKGIDWDYLQLTFQLQRYREVYREPAGYWSIWVRKDLDIL